MWHNVDLLCTFVDYKQAYEPVCRNKIIECLAQCNVPAKWKGLIELTLINTGARVNIKNEYTEEFKEECGVKQGDRLSAALFSVIVDDILKALNLRGIHLHVKTVLCLCWWYTDNYKNKTALIDLLQKLKN